MKLKLLGAVLLILCALSACTGGLKQSNNDADISSVRTSPEDNAQELKVEVGKEFEIKLAGNPSTGHDWLISKLDENLLEVTGKSFIPDTAAGSVGSGGTSVFTLKALKSGTTELTLQYKRSWSADVLKTKTYKIIAADDHSSDKKTSLLCQLNQSQSIAIFSAERQVEFIHFPQTKMKLDLKNFSTYRCPNCFSFDGSTGEMRITGFTRSEYQPIFRAQQECRLPVFLEKRWGRSGGPHFRLCRPKIL